MIPSLLAIRSIAAEFALSLYKPVTIAVGIIAAILLGLSIWLVTFSQWWLILVVFISGLILFVAAALIIIWIIIKTVNPAQTKAQRQQSKLLVEKLLRVAEVTSTPKALLLFQVVKDVIRPSQQGFIVSVTSDTKTLKNDFVALKDSFK
ncbi:MAG: hypothetical protein JWO54_553 [Candidatus Saccharibacteria bacterium]|nr:hypothetical protein [Candidatus Saccharibacteria bacterium]MDB5180786.1 hypothetical protein [Candidatus Saccharibacteria bacterium]MDB5180793.1 hypothetical protein [Candidatus Saccharibacteria bacterium]